MVAKHARLLLACWLVLAGTLWTGTPRAQERLRLAWAGGASNAVVWIVHDKGLMKKQGVNAEFITVNASPMALQAMLAGELDVIVTSVTTLVNSRLTGDMSGKGRHQGSNHFHVGAGAGGSEKLSRFSRAHPAGSGQGQCQRICRLEFCSRSPGVGTDQTALWLIGEVNANFTVGVNA